MKRCPLYTSRKGSDLSRFLFTLPESLSHTLVYFMGAFLENVYIEIVSLFIVLWCRTCVEFFMSIVKTFGAIERETLSYGLVILETTSTLFCEDICICLIEIFYLNVILIQHKNGGEKLFVFTLEPIYSG